MGLLWHSYGNAVEFLWNCFFDCRGILIFLRYLIDVGLLQACCGVDVSLLEVAVGLPGDCY